MATRVKFTAKVKRGLVTMRAVVLDGLDPSASPLRWARKKWTRAEERDFNAALAWMEQVEDDLAAQAAPAPVAIGGAA